MIFETAHYLLNDNLATTNVIDEMEIYDGTLLGGNNTEDLNVVGKLVDCFDFGSSDYITTSLDFSGFSNISVALWVNPDTQSSSKVAMSNDVGGWDDSLQMGIHPEGTFTTAKRFAVTYQRTSNTTRYSVEDDTDIVAGVWTHFIFTYDGIDMKLYRNGTLIDTTSAVINFAGNTQEVWIGGSPISGGSRFFDGKLDDIRIYDGVLNEDERNFIYNSGAGTEESTGLGDTVTLSDEIETTLITHDFIDGDTVTLSDSIELNVSQEKVQESDTVNLTDAITLAITTSQESEDILNLNDDLEIDVLTNYKDTVNITDEIEANLVLYVAKDYNNTFSMSNGTIVDVNNDIRTQKETSTDVHNDIRFLLPSQVPGDAGPQSLGKTYVKVYIDSIEQTDINIDSINITKNLNSAHTASFMLARPYDINKPTLESTVEIKYDTWTLYKGYITSIIPTDTPDSIGIQCQDEYWIKNRTKKYFKVGYKPTGDRELYYYRISEGLSACNANFGIGDFIPQTIDLFGSGESEAITNLVMNAGNFAWYYDTVGNKKLWSFGQGDIVTLERQSIGTNLGLHQVARHSFTESVNNIVNKFRVQIGQIVLRYFKSIESRYNSSEQKHIITSLTPDWDRDLEILDDGSKYADGTLKKNGVLKHPVSENDKYKDVFTKYNLPFLGITEGWSDILPPMVSVLLPFSSIWQSSLGASSLANIINGKGNFTEGFTIDYEEGKVIFNEPIYGFSVDKQGRMDAVRAPIIDIQLWKTKYYSNTEDSGDDPTTQTSNPLMFFTDKLGDYSETIMTNLNLSGLGVQIGGWHITGYDEDGKPVYEYVPSWNDIPFAQDFANWKLTKNADKKVKGNINVTIDTVCFYNIDLDNRIMIDDVIEDPLNIISMSINVGTWRASIQLENGRYYQRTISLPWHGE